MSMVSHFDPRTAGKSPEPEAEIAGVFINGVEIPAAVIAAEMDEFLDDPENPQNLEAAWHQAASAVTLRELLLQESAAQGLSGNDDDRIEALLQANIQVPVAEETHCRRYFEANPQKFRSPDLVEARHILLAASPGDDEARTQARFEAAKLIKRLQQEPGRFEEFADTYSACTSRTQGGRLGQLSRGATVPEFEGPLFANGPGLIPEAIESRYGLHVVLIDHRVDGEALPYEHVRDAISRYLEDTAFRRAVSQYLQLLAGKADIRGVDLKAATSPLVQ